MNRGRALAETLHVLSLGLWFGALVMTGVAAAIVFPEMRALDPSLPGFSAYGGSHADLAAGRVMAKVFFVCDTIQLGCAVMATLTFVIVLTLFSKGSGKPMLGVRLAILLALLAVLGYYLFALTPPMNQDLRAYWEAAAAGDASAAAVHKAAFDAAHPQAANILKTLSVLTLLALLSGVWSVARSDDGSDDQFDPRRPAPGGDALEEPMLAKRPN